MRFGYKNGNYIQINPSYILSEDKTTVNVILDGFGEIPPIPEPVPIPPVADYFIENYGLLYNYYAVTDSRQIAPVGWHVPTIEEMITLIDNIGILNNDPNYTIGDEYIYGESVYTVRKDGDTFWSENSESTNTLGFSSVGGGNLYNGIFYGFKEFAYYITSTEYGGDSVYLLNIGGGSTSTETLPNGISPDIYTLYEYKNGGYSLRYLKDDSTLSDCIGNDGKVYRTVKIGDQVWVAQNISETKYRNGDLIPELTDTLAWTGTTSGVLCAYDNDWENVTGTHLNPFSITINSIIPSDSAIVSGEGSYYHNQLVSLSAVMVERNEPINWTTTSGTQLSNIINCQFWSSSNKNINLNVLEIANTNIKYGYLYNYYAAIDARNITSSDTWRVPTRAEMTTLFSFSSKLKSRFFYSVYMTPSADQNFYKFTIKGGGARNSFTGSFEYLTARFQMISTTLISTNYYIGKCDNNGNPSSGSSVEKSYGSNIRLLRDATAGEQLMENGTYLDPYVGNDGYIYNTIKIGTQVWTAENLVETLYRNLDSIPEITDDTTWKDSVTGARCSYDNDSSNAFYVV